MTTADQNTAPVDVAVVGAGRMGRHHARTYRGMSEANLVAVVDADLARAEALADEYDCDACASTSELLEKHPTVRAVTVAVPTVHHAAAAEPLLNAGVACLVEKPLAATPEAAQRLAEFARAHHAVLQVGHTERFNPAVRAVAALGVTPRYVEVDRVSPMTFRSLDVGVVMDLMIHDLDIVLMLVRSPLERVEATGVAVLGEHEDVANARLTFASGCVATITASRIALKTERKMRLFSEQAYVSLDYQQRTGVVMRKSQNDEALSRIREQIRSGADLSDIDYAKVVHVDELAMDLPPGQQDPLTAQLTSFLDAARTGAQPVVDGAAGSAAVEAAQRVVDAIAAHRWEGLSAPRV